MVKFQPSFSFWPPPRFLGESRHGFAAWIVDRDRSLRDKHDVARDTTIQRIIDNHRDGQTIEPTKPTDV
jgi:hypothetical protein